MCFAIRKTNMYNGEMLGILKENMNNGGMHRTIEEKYE